VAHTAAVWTAGCPGAAERLRRVADGAAAAAGGVACCPLYVMNYIFDGDELDDGDLALPDIETAQYSVHVVGLVLVAATREAHIADPNGELLPGGNMEFLSLPLRARAGKPTTALSAYDVDAKAAKRRRRG
jgi:hypothetical protein